MNIKNITALLLSGGDSTRLWPIQDKCTLHFLGKPLASYSIAQLDRIGIRKIIVIVNETNRIMYEKLISKFPHIVFHFLKQTDPRGMAGAVLSAKNEIQEQPILVISPSDVYEESLLEKFQNMVKENPDGLIAGIERESYFPGGYLSILGGKVTKITEKPDPKHLPSNIVSFVFHYFKNATTFLDAINRVGKTNDDHYERAVDIMINEGKIFKYLAYKGYWGYLKFPWDTLSLLSYFLSRNNGKISRKATIAKSATLLGKIQIEDGVRILEGAKIVGPTYIGRGTIIGNNAVVRESLIGDRSVVGYSTEIARSFVGDDCWFHSNYVGDSVISNNAAFGSGAVLANFKLNETTISSNVAGEKVNTGRLKLGAIIGENVRVGVNASVMPGVKVGRNSHIGSAVLVDSDIEENVFCTHKPASYIKKKIDVKKPVAIKNVSSVHFS